MGREEVVESERWVPLKGWSASHLLPGDPPRYALTGGGGGASSFPRGGFAQGEWVPCLTGAAADGWRYGATFAGLLDRRRDGGSGVSAKLVRQRTWVREGAAPDATSAREDADVSDEAVSRGLRALWVLNDLAEADTLLAPRQDDGPRAALARAEVSLLKALLSGSAADSKAARDALAYPEHLAATRSRERASSVLSRLRGLTDRVAKSIYTGGASAEEAPRDVDAEVVAAECALAQALMLPVENRVVAAGLAFRRAVRLLDALRPLLGEQSPGEDDDVEDEEDEEEEDGDEEGGYLAGKMFASGAEDEEGGDDEREAAKARDDELVDAVSGAVAAGGELSPHALSTLQLLVGTVGLALSFVPPYLAAPLRIFIGVRRLVSQERALALLHACAAGGGIRAQVAMQILVATKPILAGKLFLSHLDSDGGGKAAAEASATAEGFEMLRSGGHPELGFTCNLVAYYLRLKSGELDEAQRELTTAVERASAQLPARSLVRLRFFEGCLQLRRFDFSASVAALDRCLTDDASKTYTARVNALFHRSCAQFALGNLDGARESWREVVANASKGPIESMLSLRATQLLCKYEGAAGVALADPLHAVEICIFFGRAASLPRAWHDEATALLEAVTGVPPSPLRSLLVAVLTRSEEGLRAACELDAATLAGDAFVVGAAHAYLADLLADRDGAGAEAQAAAKAAKRLCKRGAYERVVRGLADAASHRLKRRAKR